MTAVDYLFVYGTLRSVSANEMQGLLRQHAELVAGADVRGTLYDLGEYPGLVADREASATVRGEVYRLRPDAAQQTLRELDAYEGCGPDDPEPHEFVRAQIPVRLDTGGVVEAWAYLLTRDATGLRRIASGDYFETKSSGRPARVAERPPRFRGRPGHA